MSCGIIFRSVFAAVVLLFLVDFDELALRLVLKGDRRSGVTTGAPVRDETPTGTHDLMIYLRKYGFLPRSDQETQTPRTDGEIKEAIGRFQRLAHIPVTEKADNSTVDAMRMKRCGMPDLAPLDFRLGPSRWNKNPLTYRIVSYTSDVSQALVDDDIERALSVWSDVTPLTFRRVYNGVADLMISFQRLSHGDGYTFDGKGRVLAHAFPPGEGRGGDVHFDDDETWSVDSTGTNLFIVAAHELGHSLGLYHSDDQNSLMYPVYPGYQSPFRLSNDDIAGMQKIYGPRRGVTRVTERTRYLPGTVPRTLLPSTSTQRPRVPETTPSDDSGLCSSRLDAVAGIRGEIFAFSGKSFWRLRENDNGPAVRSLISSFWEGLPVDLDSIDAVFERPTDQAIFFFQGRKYWEFSANKLSPNFPKGGRQITDFGLPQEVDHFDAAFDWEMNQRVYLISGDTYWRLTTDGTQMEPGYPLAMDMWAGIPLPVDAAFTHFDGRTYFVKGEQFWGLEKGQMQSAVWSPQRSSSIWLQCRSEASLPSVNLSPSVLCLIVYATLTLSLRSLP